MRPKWGTHVTVIRRERCKFHDLLPFDGQLVEFDYDHEFMQTNDKHFWLPVRCDRLKDIRERCGLIREPSAKLHLTFGVMPGFGG